MQDRVWDDLINRLEDKFGDIDLKQREESRSDDLGNKILSKITYIEFEMPEGKFRVEKIVTPMILDKKTHYSHTSGNRANVEYVLSETETTSKIKVFRYSEDDDTWDEIQAPNIAF